MIDLAVAREVYGQFEMDKIGWVPSSKNMADAFSKIRKNNI